MNIIKKTLALIMALCMMLSCVPFTAWADEYEELTEPEVPTEDIALQEENPQDEQHDNEPLPEEQEEENDQEEQCEQEPDYVAFSGNAGYLTVQEAVSCGDGYVLMVRSSDESVTVSEGRGITLDLNGCTLYGNITVFGNLTVKDESNSGCVAGSIIVRAYHCRDEHGNPIDGTASGTVTFTGGHLGGGLCVLQDAYHVLTGEDPLPYAEVLGGYIEGELLAGTIDDSGYIVNDRARGKIAASGGSFLYEPYAGFVAPGHAAKNENGRYVITEAWYYAGGEECAVSVAETLQMEAVGVATGNSSVNFFYDATIGECVDVTNMIRTMGATLDEGEYANVAVEITATSAKIADGKVIGMSFNAVPVMVLHYSNGKVKMKADIPNNYLLSGITVELPVDSSLVTDKAVLYFGDEQKATLDIYSANGDRFLQFLAEGFGTSFNYITLEPTSSSTAKLVTPEAEYGYASLTLALSSARPGDTVVLVNDCTETAVLPFGVRLATDANAVFSGNLKAPDENSIVIENDGEYSVVKAHSVIRFDANGAAGYMDAVTVNYGQSAVLPECAFERGGYIFKNWNTSPDGSGVAYTAGDEVSPVDDIVLYAHWAREQYTVTYVLPKGAVNDAHNSETYYPGDVFSLRAPVLEGAQFEGWYEEESFAGEPFTAVTGETRGNKVLYSKWVFSVKVSYGEGGEVYSGEAPVASGNALSVPAGGKLALIFLPKEGYTVKQITVNGQEMEGSQFFALDNVQACEDIFVSFAPEHVTAEVITSSGEVYYPTLAEALAAAPSGSTVLLCADNAEDAILPAGVTLVLDENVSYTGILSSADEKYIPVLKDGAYSLIYAVCVVTYHVNGGFGVQPAEKFTYGVQHTLPKLTISNNKLYFAGWNTERDGSGETYANESEITVYSDTDLYAVWSEDEPVPVAAEDSQDRESEEENKEIIPVMSADAPVSYTIAYDKNAEDATGTTEPQTVTGGQSVKIRENGFTNGGYKFVGWNTDSDGSGMYYDPEDEVTPTGNMKLYAIWADEICHKVYIYKNNGGKVSRDGFYFESGGSVEVVEGNSPEFAFTPDAGYKVCNVVLKADDGTETEFGEISSYTVSDIHADYCLTVTFATGATHKIEYNLDGGVNAPENPKYFSEDYEVILKPATKVGYEFKGWFDNAGLTGDKVEKIPAGSKNDVTLYASLEPAEYSITYTNADDIGGNPTTYTADTTTITLAPAERDDYVFRGWYDNAEFQGEEITEIPSGCVGNLTFWAKWEKAYKIDYYTDGGINPSDNPKQYVESEDCVLKIPERNGYIFKGWYYDIDCKEALKDNTIHAGEKKEDLIVYAKWLKAYKVTIKIENSACGTVRYGTDELTDGTVREFAEGDSPKFTFTGKEGYIPYTVELVSGTETKVLGSIDDYTIKEINVDCTLSVSFASGTRCTITFDGNGADAGTMEKQTAILGGKVTLNANEFTKEGYAFDKWIDQDNKEYSDKDTVDVKKDLSLKVKWKESPYKITYNLNGGTNSEENPTSYAITEAVEFRDASRKGYTFEGWYENPDFTGERITGYPAGTKGNKTLYAKWKIIEYTISYELNGGTQNPNNKTTYTVNDIVNLLNPTRKHYVFEGWYETPDFSGERVYNFPRGTTGDKTLYACWSAQTYKVYVYMNADGAYGGIYYNGNKLAYGEVVIFDEGESPTFDFVPVSGYKVYNVTIRDSAGVQTKLGEKYHYKFNEIDQNYYIIVTFSRGTVNPATGDSGHVTTWMAAMGASTLGIAAVSTVSKKRKKQKD